MKMLKENRKKHKFPEKFNNCFRICSDWLAFKCEHALCAAVLSCLAYCCALHALMSYLPCAFYVPCVPCLPYIPYVLSCPTCLAYFMCSRALHALLSYLSSALRVLLGLHASHVLTSSLVLIVLFILNKNVLRFLVTSVKREQNWKRAGKR